MKRFFSFAAALLFAAFPFGCGASSASLNEDLLGTDFELEVQVSPSVSTERVVVDMGGGQPRPGEKPRVNVVGVDVPAELVFESPFTVGLARLANPADATAIVVYQLRISVAELQRQAGITGYNERQYQDLSAKESFDPERSYIVLSQTKGIAPGGWVEEMALGALPDGSSLPAGRYMAELVMVPFDARTRESMMLSAIINLPFVIRNDLIELDVEGGELALRLFNPVDASNDLVYSIQISQAEIERVSGSPHQTKETLGLQKETPGFDSAYEFVSLYESEPVGPGGYLEEASLHALPDGEMLPPGEYTGWLVRYAVDEKTGEETMLEVNTQLKLIVK